MTIDVCSLKSENIKIYKHMKYIIIFIIKALPPLY